MLLAYLDMGIHVTVQKKELRDPLVSPTKKREREMVGIQHNMETLTLPSMAASTAYELSVHILAQYTPSTHLCWQPMRLVFPKNEWKRADIDCFVEGRCW